MLLLAEGSPKKGERFRDGTTYMLFTPNHSEQRLPPPYYRGCWHGVSRDFSSESCHHLLSKRGVYDLVNLLPPCGMAGSGFRPLSKIPHCCRPKVSGPCLSPSVVDHPLESTKDLRLGELLPHQLPNPTGAHLSAELCLWRRRGYF